MLAVKDWKIKEMTGYTPITTYYTDFGIAERFGASAIRDTYRKAKQNWGNNVKYFTEIVMVLNWKIWEHNEHNEEYVSLYNELWEEADNYAMEHFKGEDLNYYLSTTD